MKFSPVAIAAVFLMLGCVPPARGIETRVAPNRASQTSLPQLYLLDATRLATVKTRLAVRDSSVLPALAKLQKEADAVLKVAPLSVTSKTMLPPSGDKHDYMSMGIYWWPDPTRPDGRPYLRRDGEINPEIKALKNSDDIQLLGRSVQTLALAFYFTQKPQYATHAAKLLRVWFLDPATRMNPNLNFGQGIPGRNEGRAEGIIDTERLIPIPDSIALLETSHALTTDEKKGLQKWFADYLNWLLTSPLGQEEGRASNNHGTIYDEQVATFALFCGRREVAEKILREVPQKRLARQIEPDGTQPEELGRTRGWTYSIKNLRGMLELAMLGDMVGVNLWNYRSSDGRSLRGAIDYLLPFAAQEKPWPHSQIGSTDLDALFPLLRLASVKMSEPRYASFAAKIYTAPSIAEHRTQLLWPTPIVAAPLASSNSPKASSKPKDF